MKDVVKGRANAIHEVLTHSGTPIAAVNASKALKLLDHVASSHPLLAKETVSRIDLGARNIAPALCNKAAKSTRHTFTRLVVTLLTSGDHDVLRALSTRMRQALISCLRAYCPPLDFTSMPTAEVNTVLELFIALEQQLLECPNQLIARLAFEAPVLESIAHTAIETASEGSRLWNSARKLFLQTIERPDIAATAHVVRILSDVLVAESQHKLMFVLDCISACPRAARMLLQTGPYVLSTPRLSSAWLASSAVICHCVRQLRTPTPIFNKNSFFEKCWSHESELVRHNGLLIATNICNLVLEQPNPDQIARACLPPLQQVESVLRKSQGKEMYAHQLYGACRILFCKEFEDSKVDGIRIAMDSGYGSSPDMLEPILRSSLSRSPSEALATIFHRHVFSTLLHASRLSFHIRELLRDILIATGLFPVGTEHEISVWLLAAGRVAQGVDELREFELFVAQAWEKPYILFDDTYPAGHISLLAASAVRRLKKISFCSTEGGWQDEHGKYNLGSLQHILMVGLFLVEWSSPKKPKASSSYFSTRYMKHGILKHSAVILKDSPLEPLYDICMYHIPLADTLEKETKSSANDACDSLCSIPEAPILWRLVDEIDVDSSLTGAVFGALDFRRFDNVADSPGLAAAQLAILIRISQIDPGLVSRLLDGWLSPLQAGDASGMTAPCQEVLGSWTRFIWILHLPISENLRLKVLIEMLSMASKGMPSLALHNTIFPVMTKLIKGLRGDSVDPDLLSTLVSRLVLLFSDSDADFEFVLESFLSLASHSNLMIRATSRLSIGKCFDSSPKFSLSDLSLRQAELLAQLSNVVTGVICIIRRQFLTRSVPKIGQLMPVVKQLMDDSRESDAGYPLLTSRVLAVLLKRDTDTAVEHATHWTRCHRRFSNCLFAIVASSLLSCESSSQCLALFFDEALQACSKGLLPSFLHRSVLCAMYRALASDNMLLRPGLPDMRSCMLKLLAGILDLTVSKPDAISFASELILACNGNQLLRGASLSEIELVERSIGQFMRVSVGAMPSDERCLKAIATALDFDLILDGAAVFVLLRLPNCYEDMISRYGKSWVISVASVVCAVTKRVSIRNMNCNIAEKLNSLEDLFSRQGLYSGSSASEDTCIRMAMDNIALVLKSTDARRRYTLPERRSHLFQVRSADIIGLLDAARLLETSDILLESNIENLEGKRYLSDSRTSGYDPLFVLGVLRQASCEAAASPRTAVLDLSAVVRGGLIDTAVSGLASCSRKIRTASYAALASFVTAVGRPSGVPSDSAAALYRDRRQLAVVLDLLRSSIREPMEQILPLFAAYYRVALAVILRPTHKANKELTRFILRKPVQDVHDAEAVCFLLREPSQTCRELALQIMQNGIQSAEDHHVARRRRFYDIVLTLDDLRENVITTLMHIVGRMKGQVAADLVRSLGIIPWLMSKPCQDAQRADPNNSLGLLSRLADCLPRGALPSRYGPSFVQALEMLSSHKNADAEQVAKAAAAVARLTPSKLHMFNVAAECDGAAQSGLVCTIYKKSVGKMHPRTVEDAIAACFVSANGDRRFPSSREDLLATQGFVAECILNDSELRIANIRNALACLALDGQQMTIWGLVASVAVLEPQAWTPVIHDLAERIPGSVGDILGNEAWEDSWSDVLTAEMKMAVAQVLLKT
jgi:Nucleolar pre-ribosomal-associated protein 1